jgi:enoyl-CoA hydratase/carnithine racemase
MREHTVTFEQRDAVTIITIKRPEAMNSFNAQLRVDRLAALKRAGANPAFLVGKPWPKVW